MNQEIPWAMPKWHNAFAAKLITREDQRCLNKRRKIFTASGRHRGHMVWLGYHLPQNTYRSTPKINEKNKITKPGNNIFIWDKGCI